MLSISAIRMSADDAAKYYTNEFSKEDYYTKGQEPKGVWRGADIFALSGPIRERDLSNLLKGCSPDGTKLVRDGGTKNVHRPG